MKAQHRWYLDEINLRGQIVADVGANIGELSQLFWDAGRGSNQVISIEPLADNVRRIRQRIAKAQAKNWKVIAEAVSTATGEVNLAVARSRRYGLNSMVSDQAGSADMPLLQVPCRALPDMVPHATVVKLDIEGHEYPVLEQCLGLMADVHSWAVELHAVANRPLQSVLGLFLGHGYTMVTPTRDAGGRWRSVPVSPLWDWQQIPAGTNEAGQPFRMLHLIARRA
ncbi:FkbM family methyltransferase [Chitinimonas sp.]|uniref:FkbM family methyltransferase n=1 Tax=Chitinimonas sp. TaxID=1934313 RepID=UPI0035AE5B8A